ncbi:caspase family protein [Micromonospora tarensis]|uniref:Caspase family protein n=1 Tax=Micromonospora tarensis TaxID=2806100 RepID=A0ABS1YJK7_9ACTN|nr:caspase family protein [Micromonospora tarensis]MBM0277593.1 caspase family protein [Micromonospora tarensis]
MRRALLIGIALYTGGYRNAIGPAVRADVQKLRRALGDSGVTVSKTLLADTAEVGSDAIRSAIAEFLIDCDVDDDLVVYFSGHGRYFDGVSYLVPSAVNPRLPDQRSYLVPVRFESEIEVSPARSVTFLIDACRDGEPGDETHRPPMSSSTATTFIFATQTSAVAHSVAGADACSVFTRALVELLPSLAPEVRLSRATALVQDRMKLICDQEGLPTQQLDVASNVNGDTAAFPLFAFSPAMHAEDRWSRLLRNELPDILGETPHGRPEPSPAQVERLLKIADDLEASASARSVLAGRPMSPWLQPGLVDRLARTLKELAPAILATPLERLVLVGLAAVVDGAFRSAEVGLLARQGSCWSLDCVVSAEPGLRRAVDWDDPASPLRQWAAHLAAVRECALDTTGHLREGIADVVRGIEPDLPAASVGRTVSYLIEAVRYAFDPSRSLTDLAPVELEIDPDPVRSSVNGWRLAAALQLLWRLSLDTRFFEPASGIHLVHDDLPLAEALAGLQEARWHRVQNLLDLSLWTRSAPIDLAVRQLVAETNEVLLNHRQPGGPLHQTKTPHLIATSRLQPEQASFRLPHVTFRVSTSETRHLLMGTNLYQDPSLAVRELYQNAVDACRYRERRLQHLQGDEYDWSPAIKFRMGVEGGRRFLECRDNGIGMSHHEIREAFAKAGRRFRDLPEFIQESAEWATDGGAEFQPISQFGIGVLSYFMIADELEVRSTRVDRRLGLQPPIRVRIRGGSDLFQISGGGQVEPTGGGTVVRLFLNPESQEFDLAEALNSTVRAPTIPVFFAGRRWQADRLYDRNGNEVTPCFRAPDLAVFFHEGPSEILVNGIPTSVSQRFRSVGCTVSLGGWAQPNLSVDRRTLLGYDQRAVSERIQQAATRVGDWADASGNWLLGLFSTDIPAARLAWQRLRDRPLTVGPAVNHVEVPDSAAYRTKPLSLMPARDGLHLRDPDLLHRRGDPRSVLDAARIAVIVDGERPSPPPGIPPFDDRLAAVLNGYRHLPTDFGPGTRQRGGGEDAVSGTFGRERVLGELQALAGHFQVTLGAVAIYGWALALLEQPASLSLTPAAAGLSARRNAQTWQSLADSPLRNLPILLRDLTFAVVSTRAVEEDVPDWPATRIVPAAAWLPAPKIDRETAMKRIAKLGAASLGDLRTEARKVLFGDEQPTTQARYTNVTPHLSRYAVLAASRDCDRVAPFHRSTIPVLNVAFAAYHASWEHGPDHDQIMAELSAAGFRTEPHVEDWSLVMAAVEACPALAHGNGRSLDDTVDDLQMVISILDGADWDELSRAIDLLVRSGVGSERLTEIVRLEPESRGQLRRHADVLGGQLSRALVTIDTVVALANLEGVTLGQSLADLERYRGLTRRFDLPARLPASLADRVPSKLVQQFFAESPWERFARSGSNWALRAVRMAALTGTSLRDIAAEVRPLLVAGGEDVAPLDQLTSVVDRPIAFDDLLVLGTQQLEPPLADPAEIAALCRPFAIDPEGLADRATPWLAAPRLKIDERDWEAVRWLLRLDAE